MKLKKFDDLKGQIMTNVYKVDDNELWFVLANGDKYKLYHEQDCCEDVRIEDICGDLNDLIGLPLLLAEEVSYPGENPEGTPAKEYQDDSWTWTFYKLATNKGAVTVRWYGESNGYYSESVDFVAV